MVAEDWDDPVRVFGHKDDAKAYALRVMRGYVATRVLDRADARRLIEQEEG